MKYFVFYVKNSEPKVKSFNTLGKARVFVDKFKSKPYDGYWVEHIMKGEFVQFYEEGLHLLRDLKNGKKNND